MDDSICGCKGLLSLDFCFPVGCLLTHDTGRFVVSNDKFWHAFMDSNSRTKGIKSSDHNATGEE
jgi:hypothetical protein